MLPSLTRTSRLFSTSAVALAGHNKWSKIRDKKGANDASKSAAVSRARNAILIAVRTGGGSTDPEKNVALAVTLRRLKDIPKDNIERALAFASKSKEKTGEHITYEVLAFGSVGVIVECLSNNPTRTIQTIREALNAHRRVLGHLTPVKFMFERKGVVKISLDTSMDESKKEALVEAALENGAMDFEDSTSDEGMTEIEFYSEPPALSQLTKAVTLAAPTCELLSSELVYSPLEKIEPSDELMSNVAQLIAALESKEDVSQVWTTLDS
ncbi:DUF28-domain-containing protein [Hymenopellis radicata]|nr:DUF28-domain-containing protein [Hymenopellis radicata]